MPSAHAVAFGVCVRMCATHTHIRHVRYQRDTERKRYKETERETEIERERERERERPAAGAEG